MGKNLQGERFLRRVDVKRETMSSVAETMTTSSLTVDSIEKQTRQAGLTGITSPVMKKIESAASVSVPQTDPTITDVEAAYGEVDIKMSSNSRKKEKKKKQAVDRYHQQTSFRTKAAPAKQPIQGGPPAVAAQLLALDVQSLMHQEDGETGYERYLAKYNEIKTELSYIDDYKAYVDSRLPELQQPGVSDQTKEEIYKYQAKLKALYDIRAYYDVLGDMLNNKYYALLPQDEMEKLSYEDLRKRLYKLYEENDPAKGELIKYYQNLVRLRELDLSGKDKAAEREKKYFEDTKPVEREDKRDPKKVMKKMGELFEKLQEYTGSGTHLCDPGTSEMYRKKFLETYKADYLKFRNMPGVDLSKSPLYELRTVYDVYLQPGGDTVNTPDTLHTIVQGFKPHNDAEIQRSSTPSQGIQLTTEQMDSVHEIGTYILEKGIEGKKIPFVNNLLQAPPDQQLLMFYLVECKLEPVSLNAAFFTALHNYKPNIERVRYFGTFETLSRAMRMSIKMQPQLTAYGQLLKETADADAEVEYDKQQGDPKNLNRTFDDKKMSVIKAMAGRGRTLKMLYMSAGLHEDMPPDMAADPVLRKKILDQYKEIGTLAGRLRDLLQAERAANPNAAAANPSPDYTSGHIPRDRAVIGDGEKEDKLEEATEALNIASEYAMDDTFGSIDNLMNAITWGEMGALNIFSTAFTGAAGILGLAGIVMNSISFGKAYDGLTAADAWAQGIGLGGDTLGVTGSFLSAATSLTEMVGNVAESFTTTAEVGKEILEHSANLSVAAGAFAMGAGIVKAGVSAVQWKRACMASDEIESSKNAREQTLRQKQASGIAITADEERLGGFLEHQQREAHIAEASAAMGTLTGAMSAVAGGLMMGGATAPVGAILGLVTVGVDVIVKVSCWGARKHNRTLTVDEYLHLKEAVSAVSQNHAETRIKNKKEKEIKDMVREEMLAMMGFASKDDCFRFICEQTADTLYRKGVLDQNPEQMYADAVSSLNMKVDRAKGQPSYNAILTKLMSQG